MTTTTKTNQLSPDTVSRILRQAEWPKDEWTSIVRDLIADEITRATLLIEQWQQAKKAYDESLAKGLIADYSVRAVALYCPPSATTIALAMLAGEVFGNKYDTQKGTQDAATSNNDN